MKNNQYRALLSALDYCRTDNLRAYRNEGMPIGSIYRYSERISVQSIGRRAREAVNLGLLSVTLRDTKNAKGVAHYKLTREGSALFRRKA